MYTVNAKCMGCGGHGPHLEESETEYPRTLCIECRIDDIRWALQHEGRPGKSRHWDGLLDHEVEDYAKILRKELSVLRKARG